MKRHFGWIFASMVSIVGVGNALAADMAVKAPVYKAPPVPVYNWTGFYVGGTVGYGWGNSRQYDPLGNSTNPYNMQGAVGGVEVGYNWQYQHAVFGLEGDFSGSGISGSSLTTPTWGCQGAVGIPPAGCSTSVQWFATQRARVGFLATDSFLIYGTGGAAEASIKNGITAICAGCATFPFATGTHTGWTAGGGVEYKFAPSWSAKLEYLHVDIGQYQWFTFLGGTDPGLSYARFDMVRVGVNYQFNWGTLVAAKY